jgi:NitT/TauT family transport system substrate-binding protein
MKRSITALILVLVAGASAAGFGAWSFLDFQKNPPENPDSILVAWSPFESTALFWIAEDRHFFEGDGLNVTLRRYDSGVAALDGVVKGEADIAVGVTEYPLVRKALQNERVRTLGSIDKGQFIYLVGRKDRGIEKGEDLEGKKVGTTFGTIAEFHLGRFLLLHGMDMGDITLVDIQTPAGWVESVANGDIDAISTAQPYANAARDRLGTNAVFWPIQSSQPLFALVISTDDWITAHPEVATRFLGSLAEAEIYLNSDPAEARSIVQRRLDLDAGYMDTVWQQNHFSLTLDQSLVLAMEDEARWMIANNLTNSTAVPDFRRYMYPDALESVRPGSVRIIG